MCPKFLSRKTVNMALVDELEKRNISPMFWPPLDDKGNAAVRWQGRSRSCSDSFATYKRKAKADEFNPKHLPRKKAKKAGKAA